ncbi:hypothetical protein A4G19_09135 [Pasteurellaceae bacterium Macca]|nr:hypothetical protein [Pasteurellaceae bacterium Macca]
MSKTVFLIKESFIKSVYAICYIIFLVWGKLFVLTGRVDHFYYIFSERKIYLYIKMFPLLWILCFCILFSNDYFSVKKNNH